MRQKSRGRGGGREMLGTSCGIRPISNVVFMFYKMSVVTHWTTLSFASLGKRFRGVEKF